MMASGSERSSRGSRFPTELLDPAEMAKANRLAAATETSFSLMERAGDAVAQAALSLVHADGRRHALVLCGPGNNGGDGYVAARALADAGCKVSVASLVPRGTLTGDAATAAAMWAGQVDDVEHARVEDAEIVIDALFGAGLARDIDGAAKSLIERVNDWSKATGKPLLAVDMPSGVDGASGAIRGSAIEASNTVTFFRLKPGHILMPGRIACGSLALADIGIGPAVLAEIRPQTSLNHPTLWESALPVPSLTGHKYSRGHALVVSGPIAQTGAARLCARGALRAGAGLVTVATPADALLVHAAALTAIMTKVADSAEDLADVLADRRKNAIVLGPGLGVGERTRAFVRAALASPNAAGPPRAVVLDADALVSFAEDPRSLFAAIKASGHAVVLTPHDGEFSKLFSFLLDISQAKPQRTREAAVLSGATVLLKGPDTVVAAPDGRASIAASEAPWLATAGSGDVLAGMIAGLLAQGMRPFEAASAAVWMHAEAARRFGRGLISEDIPEALPRVLQYLAET